MNLFNDIQASVIEKSSDLGSILLKLRLLASRLGSEPLAEWIMQELEGYSADVVPQYRFVNVAYRGTFSGPYGQVMKNAPIPTALVATLAGQDLARQKVTYGISSIEKLAQTKEFVRLDMSNLIFLLEGKIYSDCTCNDIYGFMSSSDLVGILDAVRRKILDFTIELEKAIPNVCDVELHRELVSTGEVSSKTNQIYQQTIYANTVTNSTTVMFENELEQIIRSRLEESDVTDEEKSKLLDSVKHTGVQEVIKQIVRGAPDLIKTLGALFT